MASRLCRRLKCSWEGLLHSIHGSTSVSSGHREASESTHNCRFSCLIAPICLPQDGIGLHTHMFTHAGSHTHSELYAQVVPCSACVELLVLLSLSTNPCLSICRWLSYMVASLFWIATRLCFHLLFFPFPSSLLKKVKAQIQCHFSHPLSHLSIHPWCDSRDEPALSHLYEVE